MPYQYTADERTRFWSNVQITAACWTWLGAKFSNGYGAFKRSDGKMVRAHRVAWELTRGAIPDGKLVCHSCDSSYPVGAITYRSCVNPAHLWPGTSKENMQDAMRKGRLATGERSGRRLHPETVQRGEQHYGAKFTEQDIRDIRKRYTRGDIYQYQLAAEYGVWQGTIGKIIRREKWHHVP